jgi:hypothetical protein
MESTIKRLTRIVLVITFCVSLSSCDDTQIYGSIGFSSYGGGGYYGGGPRIGTSVTIGGRIR